ncbi:gamma-glutamyl hydrolase 2 isoform X2 [Citrus clementina]|uniref:gamma-glutamyl hydrolase 2 isoform X2 n=1 Tax=Citrus clementina TaxID=85681 RepID=UPI000CED2C8A|nr:gamma-glutamyl hydrolase 2 isoform X2 [Citrus x clementina]
MPPTLFPNSDSPPATASQIHPVSSFSSSPSDTWNYIWITIFLYLFKRLSKSKPQSTILLPSQQRKNDSVPRSPAATDRRLNNRPVIGILSHPGDGASGRLNNSKNASYIAASYVKFVESAGARVIPLIYNEPEEILFGKLKLVNGVLLTGGWAKKGLYFQIVEKIFKKILEKNDAGEYFPLYAICLGFELISMIISKDRNILERFNGADQASTLKFIKNSKIEGTVFQRFAPELLKKLSTDCLVMQKHIKNAFEWGFSGVPHSEDAILVTQHVANFFVSEARKSLNRPPARKVLDNLIYNYSPIYCGKDGRGYDEVYIFT